VHTPPVGVEHPWHSVHPYWFPQLAQVDEYVFPMQAPVPASTPHPGQLQLPLNETHWAQVVAVGVPVHVGATLKSSGAGGNRSAGDLQQICPVQSLLSLHTLGHVAEQWPAQQIGAWPLPLQSVSCWHARGQASNAGFKQTPDALRFGSSAFADVQQISPFIVLQSVSPAQPFGHSEAAVQRGVS
jgi:hypothetical protein